MLFGGAATNAQYTFRGAKLDEDVQALSFTSIDELSSFIHALPSDEWQRHYPDAVRAWRAGMSRLENLQYEAERSMTLFSSRKIPPVVIRGARMNNCHFIKTTVFSTDHGKSHESIYANNERYSFKINRTTDSNNWTVGFVDKPDAEIINHAYAIEGGTFVAPYEILGVDIVSFFLETSLEIKSLHSNGLGHILISFVKEDSENDRKETRITNGSIELIPSLGWAIKEYDVYFANGNRCVCKVGYYEPDKTGIPIPQSYTRVFKIKEMQEIVDISYSSFGSCDMNMVDFTLSGYGLPEPDFNERRINRFRYFLMGTGCLMIIIALWQMHRKRKEQNR